MRPLAMAALLAATAFLSGCTLEGSYIGMDAEARFSEYDEQILRDATQAMGWNASFHGTMPGFSVDLPEAGIMYGQRGSGYVLVAAFHREEPVPPGELDGEDQEDRQRWEPIFDGWLADFERETGWTNDGVQWRKISNG